MIPRSSRRRYPRYLVQYPVIFGGMSCVGEGRLTSLSFSGYSVHCEQEPPGYGMVRVGVLLPDQQPALVIEGGTIKWVAGRQFGVELVTLPMATRQRLNRILRAALIHRLTSRSAYQRQQEFPTDLCDR